jgi:endonuclease/exonuclease/phosphatase family metal-dependent hydrolase
MERAMAKSLRAGAALLIVGAIAAGTGMRKVPAGPAEADHFPGVAEAKPFGGSTLRVATFNIDGGAEDAADLHGVADSIRGFDVVGLEEVHGNDYTTPPDQAHLLSANVHLASLFCPVERQFWGAKTFGNALLTDLPVEHWKRIPIAAESARSNRNAIVLRARFAGSDLTVIVTHVDRGGDHAREIREISSLFLSQPAPAILIGDFNCEPSDPDIANLAHTPGLEDPIGKGYDRIFIRELKVIGSGRTDRHASDHPMVWVEVNAR